MSTVYVRTISRLFITITMQTKYHLIPQFTAKDQRIHQLLAISETRRLRNPPDDAEPEPLPDSNRSGVISEDQVEDGVFVSLSSKI